MWRYGRLLAHIWLEDGTLFNELLLQEGYAEFADYGNATVWNGRYINAQTQAIDSQARLWEACDPDDDYIEYSELREGVVSYPIPPSPLPPKQ